MMNNILIIIIFFLSSLNSLASSELALSSEEVLEELLAQKNDIVGLELVIAGPYRNASLVSRFGHVFIVFINKNNEKSYYDNIAIEIVADIAPEKLTPKSKSSLDSLKNISRLYYEGVAGEFDLFMHGAFFDYYWSTYIKNQKRPMQRVIIPLNSEIRKKLFKHLESTLKNPKTLGKYKFFTNNCVVAATDFLIQAGVPIKGSTVFPMGVTETYSRSHIISSPILKIQSDYDNTDALMRFFEKESIKGLKDINTVLVDEMVLSLGVEPTYYFINATPYLSMMFETQFLEKHRYLMKNTSLSEKFKTDNDLYFLCEDLECAVNYLKVQKQFFSKEELVKQAFLRHEEVSNIDLLDDVYKRHKSFLLKAAKEKMKKIIKLTDSEISSEDSYEYRILKYEKGMAHIEFCISDYAHSSECELTFQKKVLINLEKKDEDKCMNLKEEIFIGDCTLLMEEEDVHFYMY